VASIRSHLRRATLGKEAGLIPPQLDGKRFLEDLDSLAQLGASSGGAINRVAYSPADQEARQWVEAQMRDLGLRVTRDRAGNSICCYPGRVPQLSPIGLGSHTDSVPNGGRYDGALGVAAAMACVRALRDAGVILRHPVEVLNFAAEEATMGGTLGSRAMAGTLDLGMLQTPAWDGAPISSHLKAAGLDPESLSQARRERGSLACFLELHVEQGGVLEAAGLPIGVVEGIVGIRRYTVCFEGLANHAGTTPMDGRRDALVMAAPFILAVRDIAVKRGTVGTVGSLHLEPGTPSVIPGLVRVSVETRGLSESSLDDGENDLVQAARNAGGELIALSRKPPARSDRCLLEWLISSCEELGVGYQRMPSGAGHDAMCIAHIAPQAMLFVPSRGGISHSPEEFTEPESCVTGARVLLNALLKIDAGLDAQGPA
jgi:N-carbamoyl-L-amino-acid hydrolase